MHVIGKIVKNTDVSQKYILESNSFAIKSIRASFMKK